MILELTDNWHNEIEQIKFKNEALTVLMRTGLIAAMNTLIYKTPPAYINKSAAETIMQEIESVKFKEEFFVLERKGPNLKLVKKLANERRSY